ncbi:hypothetical protein UFOVP71_340 [uncultured Caudovirales phage]|uniref:Uncharacterized protein n=1 Tax=uncultured Caudovirales phage TaxID=2100421 RepID=A0A6J5TAD0_9CAUD|nr:hypothetical protein UFOVP71_340 [uncultured Caudovirales phage]
MDFKTKEEAYDFLVRAGIIRPNEKTLEGQEKADMLIILTLLTPYETSNNQRFWTEHYQYGDKEYTVTFFEENEYEIIEISQ